MRDGRQGQTLLPESKRAVVLHLKWGSGFRGSRLGLGSGTLSDEDSGLGFRGWGSSHVTSRVRLKHHSEESASRSRRPQVEVSRIWPLQAFLRSTET